MGSVSAPRKVACRDHRGREASAAQAWLFPARQTPGAHGPPGAGPRAAPLPWAGGSARGGAGPLDGPPLPPPSCLPGAPSAGREGGLSQAAGVASPPPPPQTRTCSRFPPSSSRPEPELPRRPVCRKHQPTSESLSLLSCCVYFTTVSCVLRQRSRDGGRTGCGPCPVAGGGPIEPLEDGAGGLGLEELGSPSHSGACSWSYAPRRDQQESCLLRAPPHPPRPVLPMPRPLSLAQHGGHKALPPSQQ